MAWRAAEAGARNAQPPRRPVRVVVEGGAEYPYAPRGACLSRSNDLFYERRREAGVVARVREFNAGVALDKAMKLFWRKGYAETSVRDLVEHTGVAHAGLYAAFGGKRELYRAALEHYDATFGNFLIGPLERPDASRPEIEAFFATILDAVRKKRFVDGCFMCNTAVEFGNESDDIVVKSRDNVERMTAGFRNALKQAHVRGQVRAGLDTAATASFLTSVFHGIAVLARAKAPTGRIEESVHMALRVLD
jgi:TetR/AcrR family transcriptional regulator, transcriptional repressor for nem operon